MRPATREPSTRHSRGPIHPVACVVVGLLLLGPAPAARAQNGRVEVPEALPAVVDALEIEGLERTRRYVVERELPWKPGQEVSPRQWELGVRRLWNSELFSRVTARLEERDGRNVAVLHLEERLTISITTRFGAAGGAAWGRFGVFDLNLFGHFVAAGATYERFERYNGGQLWLRQPRLFDRRLTAELAGDIFNRPRPTFVVRRGRIALDLINEHHDYFRTGGTLELMRDTFSAPSNGVTDLPVPSRTIMTTGLLRWGLVTELRTLQDGWTAQLRPAVALTDAPQGAFFARLVGELRWLHPMSEHWMVGLRAQAGTMSGAQAQHQFFLGGLESIRGYGDNFIRALHYGLVNAEVRTVALDAGWLALMPAAFVDAAAARAPGGGFEHALSTGFGLRLILPGFVRAIVRFDVAFPLTPAHNPELVVGAHQFF